MKTCLAYELRLFTRFRPDLDALRDAALVLAGGVDGHDALPYRATIASLTTSAPRWWSSPVITWAS
jgi:hypothetical protein